MGRTAKLRTAAAVVAIVALITIVLKLSIIITLAILVIGIGTIVFLLRQDDDDDDYDGGSTKTKAKPVKAKKGKARLDEILDDKAAKAGGTTATARTSTPKPAPGGGLPTWTPGSVDSTATDEESADPFDTASSEGSWDSWEKEWPADADTLILEEDDPLASLDRLDDIDPVAEVERLDAADDDPFASLRGNLEGDAEVEETFELDELTELDDDPIAAPAAAASGSAFSFSAAPAVINEEVSTADDIMAASTATELHVEDAGDSELARLLAKVQARLSAYE